jgi:hypothetical protein
VAFVLDLVRRAGREFAKFARIIQPTIDVKEQDVVQYETNMQTQVFNRVRASVFDAAMKTDALGVKLRNLGAFSLSKFEPCFGIDALIFKIGSVVKGKEKESQECQYLSAILDIVCRD